MTLFEKIRCLLTFGQGVVLPLPKISEDTQPDELFSLWITEAESAGILLPESMSVSTVSGEGQPSSRMVLLKEHQQHNFIFYTNFGSKKSNELEHNNKVSLLFHWNVLQRQIRIEGEVEKIPQEKAAKYFHSRDRGSQIGAWASKQSNELEHPNQLKERVAYFTKKFDGQEVPLPDFWGGWQVKAHYFEFWQGRASRLHDRIIFTPSKNSNETTWQQRKLFP